MGMDVGAARGGVKSEINVTPFVDVVLVLLIIFMVLTPLLLKEIAVMVPRKADQEVTADVAAQQLVLELRASGQLQLGDQAVTLGALAERVRAAFATRRDKLLFLRVDDEASYGLAVQVMDICRGAGVQTLGMTTKN
jgi:biopolymer transport protein ExbD